jgi:hypothetical protein
VTLLRLNRNFTVESGHFLKNAVKPPTLRRIYSESDFTGVPQLVCLSEIKLAHTDDEVRQEMA